MRLFIENIKGIMDVVDNVDRVMIKRGNDKKLYLLAFYNNRDNTYNIDTRLLADVRLAYLLDVDTMKEYFRYTK